MVLVPEKTTSYPAGSGTTSPTQLRPFEAFVSVPPPSQVKVAAFAAADDAKRTSELQRIRPGVPAKIEDGDVNFMESWVSEADKGTSQRAGWSLTILRILRRGDHG